MKVDYDFCIREGLLVKGFPSKEKAFKSLEKAEKFLSDSLKNFEIDVFDGSVILSYLSIFHAARSILIRDGYREKSHACISRYLEKYYSPNKISENHIMLLDRYRNIRHMDQYDVSFYASKEEAQKIIDFAKEFIKLIQNLLK